MSGMIIDGVSLRCCLCAYRAEVERVEALRHDLALRTGAGTVLCCPCCHSALVGSNPPTALETDLEYTCPPQWVRDPPEALAVLTVRCSAHVAGWWAPRDVAL